LLKLTVFFLLGKNFPQQINQEIYKEVYYTNHWEFAIHT